MCDASGTLFDPISVDPSSIAENTVAGFKFMSPNESESSASTPCSSTPTATFSAELADDVAVDVVGDSAVDYRSDSRWRHGPEISDDVPRDR